MRRPDDDMFTPAPMSEVPPLPKIDPQPEERGEAYVYPGQVLASGRPLVATTILGTCVSVCLCDPILGLGGLNHYLLPQTPGPVSTPGRFGDSATRLLLEQLCALGAVPARLEAKVFGGMAGRWSDEGLARDLGARNVAIALESLATLGIPIVAQDTGGPRSRKLLFQTDRGRAWVRVF